MPPERPPLDILLGALNMVALPLVRGEDGDEMTETAQFYGYEDFGDHFKNVSPRITELTATRPTATALACIIDIATPRFLLPGTYKRAANRWANALKLNRTSAIAWRGAGLALTFEPLSRTDGKTAARLTLRADAVGGA